jgi:hypothetical protein
MAKYESKSLEFRKHLLNLIEYAKSDRTNFPLDESVAFLQGYIDGLVQHEMEDYDSWFKDQKENAEGEPSRLVIRWASRDGKKYSETIVS